MSLAIHLLGMPTIEEAGEPRPSPRGQKPWALLGLLLLSTEPLSRDRLADLLFTDADDPLASLRWNLAELRRALGPLAKLQGDPVRLDLPSDTTVDVRTLSTSTWAEAVTVPGLGRELLERIQPAAHPAFDAWLLAERRHYAGVSASVLREAGIGRLAAGDASGAVDLATKLVSLDEYDEEAYALLIRAHVAAGNRSEAQRFLRTTIARFRDELGIEPSATLLRAADPSNALSGYSRPATRAGAESRIAAGEAAINAGAIEAGLDTLRRAASDAEQSGDRVLVATALVALGEAYIHGVRGRDGEGSTALHAALAVAEEVGAAGLVSEASRELGYVEMKGARYDRADAWLERAIKVAPDAGLRAAALGVSGSVTHDRGRTADSIDVLTRSLDEAAPLGKPRLQAWAYSFLGRSHLMRGELPQARSAREAAMASVRSAGWMTFLPFPQALLASVDLAEGRTLAASDGFEAAFALGCQIGDPCWEGLGARGIGLIRIANGELADGMTWLADGRARAIRISDTYLWIYGWCLDTLCEQSIAHGLPDAERLITELETVAGRTGMNELLVRAYLHRAALGAPDARESAALFAARIDNPIVLQRVRVVAPVPA